MIAGWELDWRVERAVVRGAGPVRVKWARRRRATPRWRTWKVSAGPVQTGWVTSCTGVHGVQGPRPSRARTSAWTWAARPKSSPIRSKRGTRWGAPVSGTDRVNEAAAGSGRSAAEAVAAPASANARRRVRRNGTTPV